MLSILAAATLVADRCAYEGPPPLALDPAAFAAPEQVAAPLPDFDPTFDTALQKAKSDALGVAVYRRGQPVWSRTHGIAAAQHFHWASIGKSALAVAILQLVDEGRLSLDTTIERWAPDTPYADAITIADLLSHKSGLYSATEDPDQAATRPMGYADKGYFFCPGQHFKYSNDGYRQLGAILAAVEGKPWQQSVRERVLAPLGLTHAIVIDEANAASVLVPDGVGQSALEPGPAGGLAGSPSDLAVYWGALMESRLLPQPLRDTMVSCLYPMGDGVSYYGHGAMVWNMAADNLYLIGHAGGMKGQNSVVLYSPADELTVAVANVGPAQAAAIAKLFIDRARAD
ncbi:serine hydrolase domain-containing protein [Sphingomicrobium arenosum]|uniref:serine hydrolase domain-containing protein n=1 Tax=Sphingomicrobium arenosum TaxID=2233861 RepID=UPI00223FC4F7|nr:serine hydrolase domain-containing protein [Sphingomicrobium arenosum]